MTIYGLEEKELKALVSLIGDEDAEVLDHVEKKIMTLGESVIPYLTTEWERCLDPETQKRILELIHQVQFQQLKDRLETWAMSEEQDLLEGLWIIATYQYPDLELSTMRFQLEQIYFETWLEFKPDMHPFDQVKVINSVLFNKLKFAPNSKNFHAVSNSMINQVLENKRGNPISLCAIYMLVAQKMKLPIFGVNLPNLFILTYKTDTNQFYINAFNRGLIFTKSDIDNYLANLNLDQQDIFYQPCSHKDILSRVLRNLYVAFEKTGEVDNLVEIDEMLDMLK
jgi:regulator of sirC expression with transglutaminase-like and TPR domain